MKKSGTPMKRRTISIPDELARDIERFAKKEKRSFSSALVKLVEESLRYRTKRLTFLGSGKGPGDLGERAEEYLAELAREFDD